MKTHEVLISHLCFYSLVNKDEPVLDVSAILWLLPISLKEKGNNFETLILKLKEKYNISHEIQYGVDGSIYDARLTFYFEVQDIPMRDVLEDLESEVYDLLNELSDLQLIRNYFEENRAMYTSDDNYIEEYEA